MTDYLVYGLIAAIAIGPTLYPLAKRMASTTTTDVDWRQPWVALLMDLQRTLEENKNDTAAKTTKKLITEMIYDGKVA